MVWGNSGAIVGGCDGGLLQIYSSQKLLAGEKSPMARQDKHSGPVRALDFNPFQVKFKDFYFSFSFSYDSCGFDYFLSTN